MDRVRVEPTTPEQCLSFTQIQLHPYTQPWCQLIETMVLSKVTHLSGVTRDRLIKLLISTTCQYRMNE
jgi:hypothetical protein